MTVIQTTPDVKGVWTLDEFESACACEVCCYIDDTLVESGAAEAVARRLDYIAARGGRAPWVDADGWKITAGALCLVIGYNGSHLAGVAVRARVRP